MPEHTVITSASAKKLKNAAALLKKSRLRREKQCFVAEGRHLFDEIAREDLIEIYVSKSYYEAHAEEIDAAGRPVCIVDDQLFSRISDTKTPQGVLCIARIHEADAKQIIGAKNASGSDTGAPAPLILLLDRISDPGNLGTMIRTAEAAGVTGIVLSPGSADVWQPKVVRAAMGALFRMPVLTLEDDGELDAMTAQFREAGIRMYATDLKADAAYDQVDYTGPCAIVIGNESHGVSPELLDRCDRRIIIPMRGRIESLNAAIAASLVTFEAARQRRL